MWKTVAHRYEDKYFKVIVDIEIQTQGTVAAFLWYQLRIIMGNLAKETQRKWLMALGKNQ